MATVKPALNGKALQTGVSAENTSGVDTGLVFERYFTDGKISPFDNVEWEKRTALIGNEKGVTIFRQEGVEVPKNWSQTATNIVTSKYFHGKPGSRERETSVRQLIGRVANTIVRWGDEGGYFADAETREAFRDELTHLLVEQKMSFNSPVWFNVGVQPKPQCSACFINSVQDNMESIMGLTRTEGMLFKWGSGTGTNFSALRGSKETLSGGGIASGPVSFMKGFDAFAGVIKRSPISTASVRVSINQLLYFYKDPRCGWPPSSRSGFGVPIAVRPRSPEPEEQYIKVAEHR
jgi:ribonucleoside-diphosphate reductase alpha chain